MFSEIVFRGKEAIIKAVLSIDEFNEEYSFHYRVHSLSFKFKPKQEVRQKNSLPLCH
jgi:hypothetical protein